MKRQHLEVSVLAWLALVALAPACLGPKSDALFSPEPETSDAASGVAASTGARAGTDSGSGAVGSDASAARGGGDAGGGSSSASGGGSSAGAGGSGGGGSERGGTTSTAGAAPVIQDCSMVEGSQKSELNQHCYRVDLTERTFADASAACAAGGGHLVSIASEEENAYVAELHDGEHWLGANDGRADTLAGVGEYRWLDGEPFDYTDWEEGQPNAYETNCPDQGDESDCFEHCAFQSDSGDWNDRSCWHTIVSICEWDLDAPRPSGPQ